MTPLQAILLPSFHLNKVMDLPPSPAIQREKQQVLLQWEAIFDTRAQALHPQLRNNMELETERENKNISKEPPDKTRLWDCRSPAVCAFIRWVRNVGSESPVPRLHALQSHRAMGQPPPHVPKCLLSPYCD